MRPLLQLTSSPIRTLLPPTRFSRTSTRCYLMTSQHRRDSLFEQQAQVPEGVYYASTSKRALAIAVCQSTLSPRTSTLEECELGTISRSASQKRHTSGKNRRPKRSSATTNLLSTMVAFKHHCAYTVSGQSPTPTGHNHTEEESQRLSDIPIGGMWIFGFPRDQER